MLAPQSLGEAVSLRASAWNDIGVLRRGTNMSPAKKHRPNGRFESIPAITAAFAFFFQYNTIKF